MSDFLQAVQKAGFDPSQPRDERGRWSSSGGNQATDKEYVNPSGHVVKPNRRNWGDAKISAFWNDLGLMEEWLSSNEVHEFMPTPKGDTGVALTIKYGTSTKTSPDIVEIHWLTASGRGSGRAAMEKILATADRHGVRLSLWAAPLPGQGENAGFKMSKAKLESWYEDFGFKRMKRDRDGYAYMLRKPAKVQKRDVDGTQPRDARGRWEETGAPHKPPVNDITSPRWADGEARTFVLGGTAIFRMPRAAEVLKNPTQRELDRWAGREVKSVRFSIDFNSGNYVVWNAEDEIHAEVDRLVGVESYGPNISNNSDEYTPTGNAIAAIKHLADKALDVHITPDQHAALMVKLRRVSKSWFDVVKDYVWNEAYHRRAKTTPESTPGSFAPMLSGPQSLTVESYEFKRPGIRHQTKIDVIFNPDRTELKRWAGRDVKMLRWIQWGRNVIVWNSYEALHQQVANALVKAGKAKSSDFKDAYWNGDALENGPDVRTGDTSLSEMLTDYWNDVVPVKKSWLQVITESLFKWDESEHPRGKTTGESTPGSFTFSAATQAARAFEASVADSPVEVAQAFDADGRPLLGDSGKRSKRNYDLRLTAKEVALLAASRGVTLTHNHPVGVVGAKALSHSDLILAAQVNARRIRAVSGDRISEMKRGPRGWPEPKALHRAWMQEYEAELKRVGANAWNDTYEPSANVLRRVAAKFPGQLVYSDYMLKTDWREEDHPRGKTTPESNSGSFAPKEIPKQDPTLNGAGVITDSYDPDTVSAGLDRERAIENTLKEVNRLKGLVQTYYETSQGAFKQAKEQVQYLMGELGQSYPMDKIFYAIDPKGNRIEAPLTLATNLSSYEAAVAFLAGGGVNLTDEWKRFMMDGPPKTETGVVMEQVRWRAIHAADFLNNMINALSTATGTAEGLGKAEARLARLQSEAAAELAARPEFVPVPTDRIEPESIAVLAETQPLIEGDVATEQAQRYREEHAYGDEQLAKDNPKHAEALDHYIGPGYDEMNDRFRDGDNPLNSPPPAPPEKSYQSNPAYGPLYRAYYDQAYANNLKSETQYQLNKLLDQEVMRRGLESEGQIPRDEYVKLVSELRPLAEEKGKALAMQLAEKDADARAREALGVYWDESEHARALKDYEAAKGVYELIASRPPTEQPLVLYRGVKSGRSIRLDELRPGDEFLTSGFYSTSAKKAVAQRWGSRVLEIHVPKGSRNVLVTTNDGEAEIILNHNLKLEFIGHRIRRVPLPSIVPGKVTIEVTSVFTLIDDRAALSKREGGKKYRVNFGRFQTEPTIVGELAKRDTDGTQPRDERGRWVDSGTRKVEIVENIRTDEYPGIRQQRRTLELLKNPTPEEVVRWAGRDIEFVRSIGFEDLDTGEVDWFYWNADEGIHDRLWSPIMEQSGRRYRPSEDSSRWTGRRNYHKVADLRANLRKSWLQLIKEAVWREEDHPRGKTTEASTPGSFTAAHKEISLKQFRTMHGEITIEKPVFNEDEQEPDIEEVQVLLNPTSEELLRWAGRDVEEFRYIRFPNGASLWWNADDARHRTVMRVMQGMGYKFTWEDVSSFGEATPQLLRHDMQRKLGKSWLQVMKEWAEELHPRGKTTPESNAGSFAPKQWAAHHEAIHAPLRDATKLTAEDVKAGKYPLLRYEPKIYGTDHIVAEYNPTPEGPLPGVVTLSDRYFMRDPDPTLDEIGRKTLLLHEVGHALSTAMPRLRGERGWDQWFEVLAPFKSGGSGAHTKFEWPGSLSWRPEEILADVYSDLMYSKTQPWEDEAGKYAPVYKHVLAMAADAGLPLPAWYLRKDDAGWNEALHPRGKTSPKSNSGSFAFSYQQMAEALRNAVTHTLMQRLETSGGFTYQPFTLDAPTEGYALSIVRDKERVFRGGITEADVARYKLENEKLLRENPTAHLGGWVDTETGNIYLDISVIEPNLDKAIELARQHGQEGIYDLGKGQTIIVKRPEERRKSEDHPGGLSEERDPGGDRSTPERAAGAGWLQEVLKWDESRHPRGKTSPESNAGPAPRR